MKEADCTLSEAALEARRSYKREYMRKWRAANKDRVKEIERRFWERKGAKNEQAEADKS